VKFKRVYEKPKSSILLLGPRGTGKSTFIKSEIKPDMIVDLLKQETFRKLSLNPSHIEEMVAHLESNQTVLIDEIQKIPQLLDEVHRLIEDRGLVFLLTGSSARKLKKNGANLLAGRALSKKMYPLSLKEIGQEKSAQDLIFSGCLPRAVTEPDKEMVNDFLFTYVETYLKEEIFQEGLVRNLNEFSKFIELAGQYHGQILNFENLSRELGKSGDTVKSWFQILQDTLVGQLLEPYPLGIVPKEVKHPRFYFFDCGVARAAQGVQSIEEIPEQRGFFLESIILNELRTYCEVRRKRHKIFYYSISSVGDIDFIIEVKKKTLSSPAQFIAIEIKFSKTWKPDFEKILQKVKQSRPQQMLRSIGIYLGPQRLTRENVEVLPIDQFVDLLWDDKIL
jgi:predicted AAA+ superfamily ATPase